MLIVTSLVSLLLFPFSIRSTNFDQVNILSSSNDQDDLPSTFNGIQNFAPKISALNAIHTRPEIVNPVDTLFIKNLELDNVISHYFIVAHNVGHEVDDISKMTHLCHENAILQSQLIVLMESFKSFLVLKGISEILNGKRDAVGRLQTDFTRLQSVLHLVRLVNNPQNMEEPFRLYQINTLSQWEGDRQNSLRDRLSLSWTQREFYAEQRIGRTDIAFLHDREDHETCSSSLKRMYSFETVNRGDLLGGELNFE